MCIRDRDFVTSNDIIWSNNLSYGANGVELFAPSVYDPFTSISHLDESTYGNIPEHALMTPYLAPGEAYHDPGSYTMGILKDIGWTDCECPDCDNCRGLTIVGFAAMDWLSNSGTQIEDYLVEPELSLQQGNSYTYSWTPSTEDPYTINFNSIAWKIEALHNGGRYLLEECAYACHTGNSKFWTFSLDDLPDGYQWTRNHQGQVRGVITITGNEASGESFKNTLHLGIDHLPDMPMAKLKVGKTKGTVTCNTVELSLIHI